MPYNQILQTTVLKCEHDNLRKFARFKKIEQVEEFFKIVLKRSSSQQQLVLDFVLAQRAKKLTTETPQITNHNFFVPYCINQSVNRQLYLINRNVNQLV